MSDETIIKVLIWGSATAIIASLLFLTSKGICNSLHYYLKHPHELTHKMTAWLFAINIIQFAMCISLLQKYASQIDIDMIYTWLYGSKLK